MKKMNCWEFMDCGKEPGGFRSEEFGVCPASTYVAADGINGGSNGGRVCWAVAGTLCGGRPTGLFAQKIVNCMKCGFHKKVAEEEGERLRFTL